MQIFDNRRKFARYTVIIGHNVYRMSNNPHLITGVNSHDGIATKRIIRRAGKQVNFDDLNHNVREAIMLRKVV